MIDTDLFLRSILKAQEQLIMNGSESNSIVLKKRDEQGLSFIGEAYGMKLYTSSHLPDEVDIMVMTDSQLEKI